MADQTQIRHCNASRARGSARRELRRRRRKAGDGVARIAVAGLAHGHALARSWVSLLALLVGGFFVWRYLGTYESTDDAQVDGHLNAISTRVAGYVTEVNVNDNQYVEKGAVLVQIDPRDYQVAVERAKADLADAEAAAQAANLNVPVEDVNATTQVSSSEADVAGAQAAHRGRAETGRCGARAIAGSRSE